MAEEEFKPKNVEEYIKSPFEHPSKPLKRLAEGQVSLEKRVSEIEGKQEDTKLILGDEEIKKIVENRYKEIVNKEVDKAKKGAVHLIRKYLGLTTAGFFVVLALAGSVSLIYLKNKTTTGNIMNIENSIKKTKAENEKLSSDFKKYTGENNGKIKNLEEQMNSKLQDYEKTISALKTSNEEYQKGMNELKNQNQNYDKKFDELENKVSGTESRLNRMIKQENGKKK